MRKNARRVTFNGHTDEEVALGRVFIPAGEIGANGRVLIEGRVSCTNSSTPKTLRVRFGGETYLTGSPINSKWWRFQVKIRNAGDAGAQQGSGFALLSSGAVVSNAATCSSVDTNEPVEIDITAQLSRKSDSVTLEAYQVVVYPK